MRNIFQTTDNQYMSNRNKSLIRSIKVSFLSLSVLLTAVGIWSFVKADSYLHRESPLAFTHSVEEFIHLKTINDTRSISQNPKAGKKVGDFTEKTYYFPDTVLSANTKIVALETEIFRGKQLSLFLQDQLEPKPIRCLFDSTLQAKGIYHTQSAVGITSSFYKGINKWSGDTAAIAARHRLSLADEDAYNLIGYHVYWNHSPRTYWALMPQPIIYILFVLAVTTGIIFIYQIRKEKIAIKAGITYVGNNTYRLKGTWIDLNNQTILTGDKSLPLTNQQTRMLSLFLHSKNCQVPKKKLQEELWPDHHQSRANMRNAIKRTKSMLAEAGCPYTLLSENQNSDYYLLTLLDPLPEERI